MCDPVSIIGFGLSAASTMMGAQAQQAQADYQNKLAIANARNATQATLNDYNQSALRDVQEEAAAAQKVQAQVDEARALRARARVSAGESGVSGLSVDALDRSIAGDALGNITTINQNRAWTQQQSNMNKKALYTTGKSRTNEAASSMRSGPSAIGTALQIGAAGLDSYESYKARKG